MVYYIYKTENLLNGKYYIGKRQYKGDNINEDNYLGSGTLLKLAIKKYGKINFKKTIISIVETLEELNELEQKIITDKVINDVLSYNLALGGWGGNLGEIVNNKIRIICASPEYREKMSNIINSPEVKDRIVKSVKRTMADLGWKEKFSKKQKEVQNTIENKLRNSENQKVAQNKKEVIDKKRATMNELYNDTAFKEKHKTACQSESFKEKQRNKVLGKKWVNNGHEQKYIHDTQINDYLNNGWVIGMLKRKK